MKSITIKGSKRESVGKKATKALRNADMVPCVIYGGDEPISFTAHELIFKDLVYTPDAHTVVIDLGDAKINAILQDIQFHPVTDRILHIDFYQIFDDKEVTIEFLFAQQELLVVLEVVVFYVLLLVNYVLKHFLQIFQTLLKLTLQTCVLETRCMLQLLRATTTK